MPSPSSDSPPRASASRIRHISIDCAEPYALAQFWATVTGWSLGPDDKPEDDEVAVVGPDPDTVPILLFIRVPESNTVKNRVHLDLGPAATPRDEEVERLIAAGATRVADHIWPDGRGWVVLADPEGNEFCIESSDAEIAARRAQAAATQSAASHTEQPDG